MLKRMMIVAFGALAGCTALSDRLALVPQASTLELRPLVGSVMVRTVSLPTYAAVEEIPLQSPNGLIVINEDILWADAPERAVTLVLTQTLSDILSIDAGPEPWPFIGLPDVSVDIRVSRMLAGADGLFQLTGQFFVGGDGANFPNTARSFDITTQLATGDITSIPAAQAEALRLLAEEIARTLGR